MTRLKHQEFPAEEYDLRYRKARALMRKHHLDALFVSDERNTRYFSGFTPRTKNRPVFVFLPMRGSPILLASRELGIEDAKRISFIKKMIGYRLPFSEASLLDLIRDLGMESSRIGVESSDSVFGGFRPSWQYGLLDSLKGSLPRAEFVDASALLWELRIVKTEEEVNCIRRASEITAKALEAVFRTAKAGMTERQVAEALITTMMQEGADYPSLGRPGPCGFILMDATRPLGDPHYPTEKKLKKGDLLHLDTGAVFKGYHTDFTRSAVVGRPTKKQVEGWTAVRERVRTSIAKIRPGMRLAEIDVHWHGLGLDYVEAPFGGLLNRGSYGDRVMEPGLVLCVEDLVFSKSGETFAYEEVVHVTEEGHQILSIADDELKII